MKTRRSPRNQEILWRALGGQPKPAKVDKVTLAERKVALAERALADSFLGRRQRRMWERELAWARIRLGRARAEQDEQLRQQRQQEGE